MLERNGALPSKAERDSIALLNATDTRPRTRQERKMTVHKLTPAKPVAKTAKANHPAPAAETMSAAPATEGRRTIRSICEAGLLAGLPYEQIIANVKEGHPTASTSKGCISWYRTKMVQKGLLPSGKELAAQRKRAATEADHAGK